MTLPLRFALSCSYPVLAGSLLLLGGCSPASPPAGAGSNSPAPAAQHPYGAKVDSLNGLPAHRFGQPLSAFPGLQRGEGGGPLLAYSYPTGAAHDKTWFAKHRAEVPGVFYKFKEGRLASFQAVAYSAEGQAALASEAQFLFGPGRRLGDRTEWDGAKAWAILSSSFIYGKPVKVLDVSSHTLLDGPSASEQARLKADNAN